MRRRTRIFGAAATGLIASTFAAPAGAQSSSAALQVKPLLDVRARYENVDQAINEADALTFRLRAGAEATVGKFTLLADGEGTVALANDYNAFPFALAGERQWRPHYSVVADPENVELNRLQLQYRADDVTVTLGRQRINLDDQRWVGSVGWRQNEQTFDALRTEIKRGPVEVDLTYSTSQRTIFGQDAGPRTAYRGDFLLAGLSSKFGPLQGKLFAYLLDYDEPYFLANSSKTFGGIVSGALPLGRSNKIALRGSYARQSDYADNPFDYAADYWSIEGSSSLAGFSATLGWEQLGSNRGRALQAPMATLHKFNGWADMFLTTPPAGLQDAYVSVGRAVGVKALPGFNLQFAFHQFDSAAGDVEYGSEWDASAGFKLGKAVMLIKYARYDAKAFGVDTAKFWLQAEWAF